MTLVWNGYTFLNGYTEIPGKLTRQHILPSILIHRRESALSLLGMHRMLLIVQLLSSITLGFLPWLSNTGSAAKSIAGEKGSGKEACRLL